ncbi:hypothetical protein MSG28_012798 [Choristoneura fumiferana]|uniref:Uncharacterized protein n=1 Tax=Choristoneura fumiferana TaxID=7141 RepID=A0ACC0JHZ8_CHOFU|nr:hypothetical protein MSG28_012798 [Choristoneura fumiferana]
MDKQGVFPGFLTRVNKCALSVEFLKFTEGFVDIRERERKVKRGSREQGRQLMNRHNNEAGRRLAVTLQLESSPCVLALTTNLDGSILTYIKTNKKAVIKKSRVTCKCHGVSGSCSLITCWQQLATFREIGEQGAGYHRAYSVSYYEARRCCKVGAGRASGCGDYLRDKYEGATEVKVSRRGKLRLSDPRYRLPTAQDLVYLEDSPNYCVRNESLRRRNVQVAAPRRQWRLSDASVSLTPAQRQRGIRTASLRRQVCQRPSPIDAASSLRGRLLDDDARKTLSGPGP